MLRKLFDRLFGPPPPPWERPRRVGEIADGLPFTQLHKRLDQVTELGDGLIYYRDRETGQLWREEIEEDSPAPAYRLDPVTEIPASAKRL